MSEIDPDTLLPSGRMRQGAADGEVTQVHRGRAYADVGDTFSIDGVAFEVVDVEDRTLGDLTDEDARAEGYQDLEGYREVLDRAHEDFEWDDDSAVVCHRFERRE
ncbi:MAG: ASCH domain-containing protein [Halobacteriales archaeon]